MTTELATISIPRAQAREALERLSNTWQGEAVRALLEAISAALAKPMATREDIEALRESLAHHAGRCRWDLNGESCDEVTEGWLCDSHMERWLKFKADPDTGEMAEPPTVQDVAEADDPEEAREKRGTCGVSFCKEPPARDGVVMCEKHRFPASWKDHRNDIESRFGPAVDACRHCGVRFSTEFESLGVCYACGEFQHLATSETTIDPGLLVALKDTGATLEQRAQELYARHNSPPVVGAADMSHLAEEKLDAEIADLDERIVDVDLATDSDYATFDPRPETPPVNADTCLFPGCLNGSIPEANGDFCAAHAACSVMTKREIEILGDDGIEVRMTPIDPKDGRFELSFRADRPGTYRADFKTGKEEEAPIDPGTLAAALMIFRDNHVRGPRCKGSRARKASSGDAVVVTCECDETCFITLKTILAKLAEDPDFRSPYSRARRVFDEYAAMDAPKLPEDQHSSLQVLLARWECREFGGGSAAEQTLGVNEEVGELAEAMIGILAVKSAAGRMAHSILKRGQRIRGYEDAEHYRQKMADAIADVAIFAMQAATTLRLDFWALVAGVAEEVMGRKWSENPAAADWVQGLGPSVPSPEFTVGPAKPATHGQSMEFAREPVLVCRSCGSMTTLLGDGVCTECRVHGQGRCDLLESECGVCGALAVLNAENLCPECSEE